MDDKRLKTLFEDLYNVSKTLSSEEYRNLADDLLALRNDMKIMHIETDEGKLKHVVPESLSSQSEYLKDIVNYYNNSPELHNYIDKERVFPFEVDYLRLSIEILDKLPITIYEKEIAPIIKSIVDKDEEDAYFGKKIDNILTDLFIWKNRFLYDQYGADYILSFEFNYNDDGIDIIIEQEEVWNFKYFPIEFQKKVAELIKSKVNDLKEQAFELAAELTANQVYNASSLSELKKFKDEVEDLRSSLKTNPTTICRGEEYFKNLTNFYNTHNSKEVCNILLEEIGILLVKINDKIEEAEMPLNENEVRICLLHYDGKFGKEDVSLSEEQNTELTKIYKECDVDKNDKYNYDYMFFEFYYYQEHIYVVIDEQIDRPFSCFSEKFQKKLADFVEDKFKK